MSYHVSPVPFATFASSATQSVANAANAQSLTYNLDLGSKGITKVSNSRIVLPQVGNYCFTFSAIGHNSGSASAKWFNLFLRKNGTGSVDNSSTIVATSKDNPTTVVATFNIECTTAGDYYELMMAGQDTGAQVLATAAQAAVPGVSPAMPACPSILVAVWQID